MSANKVQARSPAQVSPAGARGTPKSSPSANTDRSRITFDQLSQEETVRD